MGGSGASLDAALTYSDLGLRRRGAGVAVQLAGGVIRGTGNMLVPALVTCAGASLLVPLSPLLIFGCGPVPAMGIVGGARRAAALLPGRQRWCWLRTCWSGRSLLRASARRAAALGAVRATSCASARSRRGVTVPTNLTIAVDDRAGRRGFGTAAIAGYGTASRLEYLLVPLVFGIGAPLVAMVGTYIGAGQRERALRAAWIGAALSFVLAEAIGVAAALLSRTPGSACSATIRRCSRPAAPYLRASARSTASSASGLALYFASQGAGKLAVAAARRLCPHGRRDRRRLARAHADRLA